MSEGAIVAKKTERKVSIKKGSGAKKGQAVEAELVESGAPVASPALPVPVVGVLTLPKAIELDSRSLNLAPGEKLSIAEAEDLAGKIGVVAGAILYWAGDLGELCESLFGEEASQILDASVFDEETLWAARAVAKAVPVENRRLAPTWNHARAVSHLKPKEQAKYLQLALDEEWSIAKLKAEARKSETPGSVVQYIVLVRCKNEAQCEKVKKELEREGLTVTVRTSVKSEKKGKAKRSTTPKRKEITAQKKRRGAPKMYTRRRTPK